MMLATAKRLVRRIIRPPLHKPDAARPHGVYGSAYGGWPLLDDTPRGALIHSFGVGEDVSFDLAAIERFGAEVHAFDPTPRALDWIAGRDLPPEFHFHPIGLAARDGTAEFFAPKVDAHVSFSLAPDPDASAPASVTAKVMRFASIIAHLGGRTPEALKMDIEGFEYEVIDDLLAGEIRPRQLLVEFHHGMYGVDRSRTLKAVARLRAAGYRLFYVSEIGREYGFVHAP